MAGTAGLRCHGPNGAYQGRECGNQQPMHGTSCRPLVLRCRLEQQPVASSGQGPRPPRQTRSCSSVSALAAAAVVPVVGSAALRVDPGHSRAACIETRAAAMPLAAPFALDQLQQQRMAGTAGPSLPEPTGVACTKAVSGVRHISSPCTSRAPRCTGCTWCTWCAQLACSSRPLVLRCRLE